MRNVKRIEYFTTNSTSHVHVHCVPVRRTVQCINLVWYVYWQLQASSSFIACFWLVVRHHLSSTGLPTVLSVQAQGHTSHNGLYGSGCIGFPKENNGCGLPVDFAFLRRSFGKTKVVHRCFQSAWFKQWQWLHYDSSQDLAHCLITPVVCVSVGVAYFAV